jgi:hypothetical protein
LLLAVPHIQRNARTSAQRISYTDLLEVAKEAAEAGARVRGGSHVPILVYWPTSRYPSFE